jgi:hypothetical protein
MACPHPAQRRDFFKTWQIDYCHEFWIEPRGRTEKPPGSREPSGVDAAPTAMAGLNAY